MKKVIGHIKDYYIGTIVVGLLLLAAIIFLVHDFSKQQKETELYVAVIDSEWQEEDIEQFRTGVEELLSLDDNTQKCVIESDYSGNQNISSAATTSAYMRTGQVDLVIAPEEKINRYAAADYLLPLKQDDDIRKVLEKKELKQLFYASLYDYSKAGAVLEIPFHPHEVREDSDCYGIYLGDTVPGLEGYVIGIMKNAEHMGNAKRILIACIDE